MRKKEVLVCAVCKYQEPYKGTYSKPPACPKCRNLLSFSDSLEADYEQEIPFLNKMLTGLAAVVIIGAIVTIFSWFRTSDARGIMVKEAVSGQAFYGGKAHSKIPVEFASTPYSYDRYWTAAYRGKVGKMFHEDHRYLFQGIRNGKVQIQYLYTASGGKKGSQLFLLPLTGNQAVLDVPSIPYIENSRPRRVTLTLTPANHVMVQEQVLAIPSKKVVLAKKKS